MPERENSFTLEEMETVLREQRFGFLGLAADSEPYVVPLNYGYVAGKVLFHCALEGRKLDMLRADQQVCFTVASQVGPVERHPSDDPCHGNFDSIICFGEARIVEELEERRQLLDQFNRCLLPGAEGITTEDAAKCYAVEIVISRMTCRREQEGKRTYGQHQFKDTRTG
jgi:nitroimidazol reductase NimA-like FMN-containing flavoprotein (pyridoxamine 5'-phosphate oxidase superfamily)